MADSFQTTRRIEFRDTDAAGIAHFSRFFTLMEEVEHEFLRNLGGSVHREDPELGVVSWPRVAAKCDYSGAVRFEQTLIVALVVLRIGNSSVTYGFEFTCEGRPIAKGQMTAVCCVIEPDKPPRSIPIPPELSQQLQAYRVDRDES